MAATDLDRLVLVLEAQTSGIERQLKKFNGTVDRSMKQASRSAGALDKALARASARIGDLATAWISANALRGAQHLIDAATRIDNSLKVAGLSGEELTRVYDRLFESATKNAAPLESLVTLYGRASLVQKELGVSTDELIQFTDRVAMALRVSGQSAEASRGALLQLGQALSTGVVRAEEYNSLQEGAVPILRAVAAGLEEAGGSVGTLTNLVKTGQVTSEAFFRAFEAGAPLLEGQVANSVFTIDQRLVNLQNSLIDAAGRFNESTEAAETFGTAIDNTAAFVNSINFDGLISQIQGVINQIGAGIDAANSWAAAIGRVTGLDYLGKIAAGGSGYGEAFGGAFTITSQRGIEDRINEAFAGEIQKAGDLTAEAIKNSVLGEGGAATTQKTGRLPEAPYVAPVSLSDFAPPAAKGGGGGGGGRKKSDAAALREAAKAAKELEKAQRDAERAAQDMGSAIGDAVGGLASAFADGKLEASELLGIVTQLASQLFSLSDPKGFGGGFLSSILGSFGGFFATGGNLGAGKWGIAGEAGPELIRGPANITPLGNVNPPSLSPRSGPAQSIVINAPINAPGADAAALARVERSVHELGKNIPKMVDARTDARQTRRVRA